MSGIHEDVDQHFLHALTFAVLGEHVLHPVQRLNHADGQPAQYRRPGTACLETDLLVAELDSRQRKHCPKSAAIFGQDDKTRADTSRQVLLDYGRGGRFA